MTAIATGGEPGRALYVGPGEGEKATSAETAGRFALLEGSYPAGAERVPPHVHHDADEGFYVLDGDLTVWAGAERIVAPAGSFVLVPRGTVHSIGNDAADAARFLVLFSPGGMEGFFREQPAVQAETAGRDAADVQRAWDELAARYQMEWRDLPA